MVGVFVNNGLERMLAKTWYADFRSD